MARTDPSKADVSDAPNDVSNDASEGLLRITPFPPAVEFRSRYARFLIGKIFVDDMYLKTVTPGNVADSSGIWAVNGQWAFPWSNGVGYAPMYSFDVKT